MTESAAPQQSASAYTSEGAGSIEVIIPLKDMEQYVAGCLESLIPQLRVDDRITVVDDGSTDRTADLAREQGVSVLSLSESRGPYGGRDLAARRSSADFLLFVDGRSQARPGLLTSHRAQLGQPGCALSCTNVEVVRGTSLASRVASLQDMFALERYVGVPGRMDYFPTCNLGVSRWAYNAIGGFRDVRSGSDADLCWRIQRAGLGGIGCDPNTLMSWVPRDDLRALAKQWYRYGQSGAELSSMHASGDADPTPARPQWHRLRRTVNQACRDPLATTFMICFELIARIGRIRRSSGRGA